MALTPLTKTTYVAQTTPVSSSNLNATQDAVIELQNKVIITDASQGLTSTQKANARANIGLDYTVVSTF